MHGEETGRTEAAVSPSMSAADYGLAVEYSDVGATTDPTGEDRKYVQGLRQACQLRHRRRRSTAVTGPLA